LAHKPLRVSLQRVSSIGTKITRAASTLDASGKLLNKHGVFLALAILGNPDNNNQDVFAAHRASLPSAADLSDIPVFWKDSQTLSLLKQVGYFVTISAPTNIQPPLNEKPLRMTGLAPRLRQI
jgi:hypothetical protein